MTAALDASALLAYLQGEAGAVEVAAAIAAGACISAVNLAEVLTKRADAGDDPEELVARLTRSGLIGPSVEVAEVALEDAVAIARLRPGTRSAGLSLGDRACLALGRRRDLPVLTADTAWADLAVGVTVRTIR